MALAPDNTTSRQLRRTSTLPSIAQLTLGTWVTRATAAFLDPFMISNAGGNPFLSNYIWLASNANNVYLEIFDGSNWLDTQTATSPIPPGAWYYLALTIDGPDYEVFLSTEDNVFDMTSVLTFSATSGITIPAQIAANIPAGSAGGAIANFKVWEAILTPAELRLERDAYAITRTADIWTAVPLDVVATGLLDISGNGNNLTEQFGRGLIEVTGPAVLSGGGGPVPPPNPPSNLTVVPEGYEALRLNWQDNSSDEAGFRVEVCAGGLGVCGTDDANYTQIAGPPPGPLGPGVTTWLDTNLFPEVTYAYRVRAEPNAFAPGPSDWVYGEGTTLTNFSVQFPGTPGSYYYMSPGPTKSINSGNGILAGGVAWVRLDNTGTATIMTIIESWSRAWRDTATQPAPPGTEYDYANPLQSYLWWGVRNGALTLEVQDGRDRARSGGAWHGNPQGGTPQGALLNGFWLSAAERTAAIAAWRAEYSYLPNNEASLATVTTWEEGFDPVPGVQYWAQGPTPYDTVHSTTNSPNGDFKQFVRLTGPVLDLGVWHRVGWNWVTNPPVTGNFTTSTLELWVGCTRVATAPWQNLQGTTGFFDFFLQAPTTPPKILQHFVGGDPNAIHLNMGGLSPVPIALYDYKYWTHVEDVILAEECTCEGVQPTVWWKLRDTSDLDDYGNATLVPAGVLFPANVAGSPDDIATQPFNPCNDGGPSGPPQPPPPQPPPPQPPPPVVPPGGPACPVDFAPDAPSDDACAPHWVP